MPEDFSRRNFLRGSAGAALAAAPAILPAQGQNNKVTVGWIGTGSRGNYVMNQTYKSVPELVNVVAVCDTYEGNKNRAKDLVQTTEKQTPKTFVDYHDILKDPSIDVVFITTPEHLHYEMAMAALKAGKNIYLEKPLAHTIEEGWDIVRAAEKSGKVVQVGTQNRSNSLYIQARQMIRDGMIGDVHYVRAFWYRNSAETEPAWRYAIPPDANEQNTDWNRFLGSAKKRPFDKGRYYQWRLYWDYSGGISTDLLVHQTDVTNFVCDKTLPHSCVASGGIYRWVKDDREVPDCLSAVYEYSDRFHINYSCYFGNDRFGYGEQFMGNEGTIEVISRQFLNFYPEKFGGKPPAQVAARKELSVSLPGNDNLAVQDHVKNFILGVLGKEKVIAPVSIGQQAAISGHMATLAFKSKKMVVWDAKANKVQYV